MFRSEKGRIRVEWVVRKVKKEELRGCDSSGEGSVGELTRRQQPSEGTKTQRKGRGLRRNGEPVVSM